MKRFLKLWLCLVFAAAMQATAQTGKPVVHSYAFDDGGILTGMSDNGLWAVASATNSSNTLILENPRLLGVDSGTELLLSEGYEEGESLNCGANDVTNDGNVVVGRFGGLPAVWRRTGETSGAWAQLPVPDGYDGGVVNAVTPDGKYAVGVATTSTNILLEKEVLWDLATNAILPTPGLPAKDAAHLDQGQSRFTAISADGRYVLGCKSFSYLPTDTDLGGCCYYVYDREQSTYKIIGFTESATGRWSPHAPGLFYLSIVRMTNNGRYVSGAAHIVKELAESEYPSEYEAPFVYDVENDSFTLFDTDEDNGIGAWCATNSGQLLGAAPFANPYREWTVKKGNYWVSFQQILAQKYDFDFLKNTTYANTGTPIAISDDGCRICVFAGAGESYIVTLPESISAAAEGINLLHAWTSDPAGGVAIAKLQKITVTFDRNVSVLGAANAVELRDEAGAKVYSSVSFKADSPSKTVTIQFRKGNFEAGKNYTLHIPAGTICIDGDGEHTNDDIDIPFLGRADEPVRLTASTPQDGASVLRIDTDTNPLILTFDTQVKSAEGATAKVYRQGEAEAYQQLYLATQGNQVLVYPTAPLQLYKGVHYRIGIPQGAVTDVTGNNPSDSITLHFDGLYEREISLDERTLLSEDFSNGFVSFMLWEGDHLTPASAMKAWGFADADNYPWSLVRDDEESTDLAAASHSMYTAAGASDDWMVSRQIYIPDSLCMLQFQSQSYLAAANDVLKVIVWPCEEEYPSLSASVINRIRTEGTVVYEQRQSPGATAETMAGEWTNNSINLKDFAGKSIYIAFVNNNEGQSAIFVDNIVVEHDASFIVTIDSDDIVTAKESIAIKGRISTFDPAASYEGLSLTLRNADGTAVSTVDMPEATLAPGEAQAFAFPDELPLTVGEENFYTIDIRLGEAAGAVRKSVKNLSFSPVKRVVLEELTGQNCVNCPLGILAIEKIRSIYGSLFIPVSIHAYDGDALGEAFRGYSDFLGLSAAPSGKVHRSNTISSPMYSANSRDFEFSNPDNPVWLDLVQSELALPAEAEVNISPALSEDGQTVVVPSTVRYALNADRLNLSLLLVLVEDNVKGYQQSKFQTDTDPDLGAWSSGGIYAKSTVYPYYHEDVVRSVAGNSYIGTAGLLPSAIESGTPYTATLSTALPAAVTDVQQLKAVVMLFDADTGRLINAASAHMGESTGIHALAAGEGNAAAAPRAVPVKGGVLVTSSAPAAAAAYSADGRLLGRASGTGQFRISTAGYRGIVLVRIAAGNGTTAEKMLVE